MRNNKKLSTEQFIEKARRIHGDKYDYSKVEYVNNHTKVCIICPEHGEFWQTPNSHISQRQGCPRCYGNKKYTTEEFIEKAKKIHGDKYDYSKVEYVNNFTKVHIICPEHGEFLESPQHHLEGHGCKKCSNRNRPSTEEFIEKAKKIHGDKYDYSKVEYGKNNKEKVEIICPKHGSFYMKPVNHTVQHQGCPECSKENKSLGELKIKNFLDSLNIKYIHDKASIKCLGRKRPDFYLPDYNLVIEYDGKQHFSQPHGAWKSWYISLEKIKEDDINKTKILTENGYIVLRIPYYDFDNIENIITAKLKLITEEKYAFK